MLNPRHDKRNVGRPLTFRAILATPPEGGRMSAKRLVTVTIGVGGLGIAQVSTAEEGDGAMSAAACETAQREGKPCTGWSPDALLNLRCSVAERELPARAAIQPEGASHLLQLAMEKRVDVVLRPVTAIAPSLRGLGHPGKPETVKWKSCTVEDQYIGAPVGRQEHGLRDWLDRPSGASDKLSFALGEAAGRHTPP